MDFKEIVRIILFIGVVVALVVGGIFLDAIALKFQLWLIGG